MQATSTSSGSANSASKGSNALASATPAATTRAGATSHPFAGRVSAAVLTIDGLGHHAVVFGPALTQPSGEPSHGGSPPPRLDSQEDRRTREDSSADRNPRTDRSAQPMRDGVRHQPRRPRHDGRTSDEPDQRRRQPLAPGVAEVPP